MSSINGEMGMQDMTDKATYERLEKDVASVKNDISALADQITDALNTIAGTARKQARRGYKNARANVDSVVDDLSERGERHDGRRPGRGRIGGRNAGECHHRASACDRRPCAWAWLPDRRDLAPVRLGAEIGVNDRRSELTQVTTSEAGRC